MTVICPQRSPLILHNRHIRMYSTKDCRICGAQRDQPTVSCCSYRAIDKWGRSSKRIDIDDIESLACILFSRKEKGACLLNREKALLLKSVDGARFLGEGKRRRVCVV